MATSALRSTSPGGSTSATATPTLAVSAICWPATRNGSPPTAPVSRSAISATSWELPAFSTRMANSSLPQRATVSCTGTTARSRLGQHEVARAVADRVVDRGEAIQVQEDDAGPGGHRGVAQHVTGALLDVG